MSDAAHPTRFKAGTRGINRITAFLRPDSPYWYIEWWEDAPTGERKRMIRQMSHVTGYPVTSPGQAKMVIEMVANRIQAQRATDMMMEALHRGDLPYPNGVPGVVQRERTEAPGIQYASHPSNPVPPPPALPEGITEEGRGKTLQDLLSLQVGILQDRGKAQSTIDNYQSATNFIGRKIPLDTRIAEIDSRAMREAVRDMGHQLGASTLAKYSSALKRMFATAHEEGWTDRNLLRHFEKTPGGESRLETGKFYPAGVEEKIISKLEDPETEFVARVILHAGLRPGDLALWRESFVTESIHAGRRMLSFDIPKHLRKGGGGRGVPARGYLWDERLLELWDTAIKPNLTKGVMVPGAKHQESAAVNAAKRRWSREWEMAEEEAGVEKITGRSIYALKHRFVTRCIASDQLAYAAMSCGVDEGTLRKYYNVDRANPDFEAMFQVLDGTPPDASEGDAEAA